MRYPKYKNKVHKLLEDTETLTADLTDLSTQVQSKLKSNTSLLPDKKKDAEEHPFGEVTEYNTFNDLSPEEMAGLPTGGLGRIPKNINKNRYYKVTENTIDEIYKVTNPSASYYVAIGVAELAKSIIMNKLMARTNTGYVEFIDWNKIDDILQIPSIILVLNKTYIDDYFSVYDIDDPYVDLQFSYASDVIHSDIHPINEYLTQVVVIRDRNLIVIDENGDKTMIDPRLVKLMLEEYDEFKDIPVHIIDAEDIVDGVDGNVISGFKKLKQALSATLPTPNEINNDRLLGHPSRVVTTTPVGYGYYAPTIPVYDRVYVKPVYPTYPDPRYYGSVPPPPPPPPPNGNINVVNSPNSGQWNGNSVIVDPNYQGSDVPPEAMQPPVSDIGSNESTKEPTSNSVAGQLVNQTNNNNGQANPKKEGQPNPEELPPDEEEDDKNNSSNESYSCSRHSTFAGMLLEDLRKI